MVTQAAEKHAMRRFPSHVRQKMVEAAARAMPVQRAVAITTNADLEDALADRHIGYAHAILLQCFLPQRPIEARNYDVSHGCASLAINAGRVADPSRPNRWIRRRIPAGPKARLILPCLIGQAVREDSPRIDLGRSLPRFMAQLVVPVTDQNGRTKRDQMQNLAAAHITIGEWTDDVVHTHTARSTNLQLLAGARPGPPDSLDATTTRSDDFYRAVQGRRVPLDIGHLARMGCSLRRMDLYAWLSYRTPKVRPNLPRLRGRTPGGRSLGSPFEAPGGICGAPRAAAVRHALTAPANRVRKGTRMRTYS